MGNRAAVVRNIPRLLAMRKPSRAVLEEALLVLNHPEDAELRRKIGATLARVTSSPAPEM